MSLVVDDRRSVFRLILALNNDIVVIGRFIRVEYPLGQVSVPFVTMCSLFRLCSTPCSGRIS